MKLLITGGCGFLGSNLAIEALSKNYELIIVDNLSRFGSKENLNWLKEKGRFKFYLDDIRNQIKLESIIIKEEPEAIFHLAGQVAMTTSIKNPREDFEINVLGSINLLEAVRKNVPTCYVIYSSTNKVYGDLEWLSFSETDTRYITSDFPNGFPESLNLEFHSPYGCSKGAADQYMLDYYRIFGIKTSVFRHSSMFGARQFSTYDQGWLGWFCQKALEVKQGGLHKLIQILGNGKQVRDVLYSDDMVRLYFKTLENIEKTKGQAFNIGGGMNNSLSLLELFQILESELNIKLQYKQIAPRESDQKVFVADLKKIFEFTGWQPKILKVDGIRKMLKWEEGINGK